MKGQISSEKGSLLPQFSCVTLALKEAALGAMATGTRVPDLDRGLPQKMLAL